MQSETLYKYRDWNDKFHKKMLTENEVYFSNNYSFNDPFDLNLPIVISGTTQFDELSFREDFSRSNRREPTKKEINDALRNFPNLARKHPEIIEETKKEMEQIVRNIEERLGVFCLSRNRSNTLMWGHYANSHKGFFYWV